MPTALTLRWLGRPCRGELDGITTALEPLTERFTFTAGARRVRIASYLDTADWRLRRRGRVLTHQGASGPGSLVLGEQAFKLSEPPMWPARAGDLPPGPVRDEVAPAMGVRAIAPKIRTRTVTREVALTDGDGEEAGRAEWAEAATLHPKRSAPLMRVTLRPAPGRRGEMKRAARRLVATGWFEPADDTLYEDLLRECALPEPDPEPAVAPGMPAPVAVARALLGFADSIAANVDGTVDDVDPEYLHDLRVAVRRTRSLLKIAGDVLPGDLAERFAPRFKELGDLTTPVRDLDVHLLAFDDLAAGLTVATAAALAPFAGYLRTRRAAERKTLVRGLKAQRFTRMLDDWRAALREVIDSGGGDGSGGTVEELAGQRLRRIRKKVVRHARTLAADSPAEDVHTLRKRCKELRYALEVFRPLLDAGAYRDVLKELKRLQDVLGSFQDGEVQSAQLREAAGHLEGDTTTLLALGELLAKFVQQEQQARAALPGTIDRFLTKVGRFDALAG